MRYNLDVQVSTIFWNIIFLNTLMQKSHAFHMIMCFSHDYILYVTLSYEEHVKVLFNMLSHEPMKIICDIMIIICAHIFKKWIAWKKHVKKKCEA